MTIFKSLTLVLFCVCSVSGGRAESPLLFPPEQFDAVDLVPTQSNAGNAGLLETLGSLVDRFEPINGFSDTNRYRRLGRAIGRLKILLTMPDGTRGISTCTATLIAADRLITNYHCVPGVEGQRIEQVKVEFFYLELGSTAMRAFAVEPEPVEADRALDFAVLRVTGEPTRVTDIAPVPFTPRTIQKSESLFLIHHPAGQPQRLTRAFCRAHATSALEGAEIRHLCDTLPGSSGALVFADDDFAIVGIHHRGGLAPGDMSSFNRGTDVGALTKQSPVLAALTAAQAGPAEDKIRPPPEAPTQSSPMANLEKPAQCDGIEIDVGTGNARLCVKPGQSFRDCQDKDFADNFICPEMVVVPAGNFTMGSPDSEKGRDRDEGPRRQVTIARPIAVGKYEVTFAEWDGCVYARGCKYMPLGKWGRGKQPVVDVSWDDVWHDYLPWLSSRAGRPYRLLSEAEWEYSARAGAATEYAFGSSISSSEAQFSGDSGGRHGTAEVGSFKPNAFGLFDMHGNVWEWVEDFWHKNYVGAPAESSVWKLRVDADRRVRRGGSWDNSAVQLRASNRAFDSPELRSISIGFRVARSL